MNEDESEEFIALPASLCLSGSQYNMRLFVRPHVIVGPPMGLIEEAWLMLSDGMSLPGSEAALC